MSEVAERNSGLTEIDRPGSLPATRRRFNLKRLLMGVALGALVLAGATYGRHWWTMARFLESTDDAYVGGEVTVIAPKVPGFIDQVAVGDNQAVHAGDLLVRIDDRDYRAALARAEASVAAQQAAIGNLDATRALQQALVMQAEAELVSAQAETARTRADFDRYHQLSSAQYASQQRFEQADADLKKAKAGEQRAEAALEAARRQIEVIDSQKRQAEAALDQARADRDIARLNVGFTQLRAPIDGVVGNRSARVGAYADAGAALLSVVPARGLWVDANFKESQLAGLHPGQEALITADVLPGEVFRGRVESLAPATGAQFSVLPPENATGNFTKIVQRVPVRILLDGDAAHLAVLRPGLSVTAEVDRRGGAAGKAQVGEAQAGTAAVVAAEHP
ncbi:HlyD family secretion protein [Ancylobacter defluvii]|uniref:Secretion protein HlyD n=1 Tax=Ancylobacter defluvii TaxID=1282440 RepID=A0A9W6JUS8_9HYPH|nr:HlyD family secretion protein [Ancylobacter defluvii]GLK84270.1 secretion protein HlyD [Ancylobacter defluvii]